MASRHRSRELAVQFCYQMEIHPQTLNDSLVISRFWKEQAQSPDDNKSFFDFLVKGVADQLPAIDRRIEQILQNWKMNRVEKVDLAILRVAVFELVFNQEADKPDAAVVINEAVEIAKKFGNQGSPSFVNGILDSLKKKEINVS